MDGNRRYILVIAILLLTGLPATGAYFLYVFTKNPSLRPLGISQEKLAAVEGPAKSVSIQVHVDWGSDRTGAVTQADLRKLISGTLSTRTEDFIFEFNDVPGDQIGVTFVVGANRYGPFPPGRLIEGIVPALAALDMTKRARG